MAQVVLDQIDKIYPNGVHAVHGLDLEIADGEFLVLVGPSGCGKSTALRMIAGLEEISSGKLMIGDRIVNDMPPKDRDIAMVFQNYALYPHMTVYDNIGFPLKLSKTPKAEIDKRVRDTAEILELEDLLDRKPGHLSGGQRQRVAMGRAIVRQPSAFLMDEPLSNLDAKLRVQMRAEIARIQRNLGITTVYVTHDQVEAMTMGDRVAVLKDGFLQQVDSPQNLYDNPANIFVAAFIGSPSMNIYECQLGEIGTDGAILTFGQVSLQVPKSVFDASPELAKHANGPVTAGFRPEDMEDTAITPDHPANQRFSAEVKLKESLGAEIMVHFSIDATAVDSGDPDAIEVVGSKDLANCVARISPRSQVGLGDTIEVGVDTGRMRFFDSDTGEAL